MHDNLHIVTDLALILISAGFITIIFKLLKQPLVLGYIVAGFIVGPHFKLFPTVIEQTGVEEWSEIGIIFLLFALGLEFSFKKLLKVGSTAVIGAAAEIITMMCIGFLTGYLLGWSSMESIFLGGMLAMSSTTIIIKAFDDMGLKKQQFADITMVILIIQDLVAIVMMVLLSTAAASQKFAGMEMLWCIGKLIFFMVLWFVVGISIIPTFFRKAKKYINHETLLILSIGLCFGMVLFANAVGFSSALGAFVMGSILSETVEGEHIQSLIKSIKDLFGAIFFVSVGMMVDPHILVEYWGIILVLTVIVLFIKSFVSSAGLIFAGRSLQVSLATGFSLAQIGEFAFIIASLGVSLGVMRPFIYPIIVAVAVITTFTTPYYIRLADPVYRLLNKKLPPEFIKKIDGYSITVNNIKVSQSWNKIIRLSLTRTIVFAVICICVIILSFNYLYPFTLKQLVNMLPIVAINTINCLVTLVLMSPFLYGLIKHGSRAQEEYAVLWRENKYNQIVIVAWSLLRIFTACFFVILVLSKCFKFTPWVIGLIAISIIIFIALSRHVLKRYVKIEKNFMQNLNAKEMENPEDQETKKE